MYFRNFEDKVTKEVDIHSSELRNIANYSERLAEERGMSLSDQTFVAAGAKETGGRVIMLLEPTRNENGADCYCAYLDNGNGFSRFSKDICETKQQAETLCEEISYVGKKEAYYHLSELKTIVDKERNKSITKA